MVWAEENHVKNRDTQISHRLTGTNYYTSRRKVVLSQKVDFAFLLENRFNIQMTNKYDPAYLYGQIEMYLLQKVILLNKSL